MAAARENLAEFARARSAAEAIHSDGGDGGARARLAGFTSPSTSTRCSTSTSSAGSAPPRRRRRRRGNSTTTASTAKRRDGVGARRDDAPPVPDAAVPADDLFGASNIEYMRTSATSRAPRRAATRASAPSPRTRLSAPRTGGPRLRTRTARACVRRPFGRTGVRGQAREIRAVALWLCGQEVSSSRFPGSQPVSLARDNMHELASREYHVTWKADGTRYMLLCMRDGAYLSTASSRCVASRFGSRRRSRRTAWRRTTRRFWTARWWWTICRTATAPAVPGVRLRRVPGESLVTRPFLERFRKSLATSSIRARVLASREERRVRLFARAVQRAAQGFHSPRRNREVRQRLYSSTDTRV